MSKPGETSKPAGPVPGGVVGFFDDAHSLVEAVKQVRSANKFKSFDTYTPYPIHGLEKIQGLKRSPLPYVTFGAGITGTCLAFLIQYWTSVIDWPVNIGGKPLNSWPAFVPVMFELTVLLGGLATVAAMFLLNGLPNTKRKAIDPSLTRDRFALVIDAPVAESEASDFLKKVGAKEVRSFMWEGWF
ncbi:MAG: DUF3341 domain-containing protein [Bdellovibrionales bacterium]|nr:DUF3341 domain-containing protein [Bdellovibrionales bacterium]